MGGMGLMMLIGLIIAAAVMIVVARQYGSLEPKSKRKNDDLLRSDGSYILGDDGEIIEYAEEKAKQRI